MRYLNTAVLIILLIVLYQIPVTAELVISINNANINSRKNKPLKTWGSSMKDDSNSDVIKFRNGDIFHGKMLSIKSGKEILWKTSEALQNILFFPRNVSEIDFNSHFLQNKKANTSVLLTNGDILEGTLVSMNEKNLILDTRYAGKITIDSNMIREIFPDANDPGLLYRGPESIDEWIMFENRSNGKVSVDDQTLSMSGYCTLGRDMKLSELSRIEFSLEATGNYQMQLLFYTDETLSNLHSYYALSFSSGYIYLQRYRQQAQAVHLGNVQCNDLRSGKEKITLLLDKKNKIIMLLVNDVMIKQWVDTQESGDGTYVCFVNQSAGTIKIKDIEVSQWDGEIPDSKNKYENKKKDTITFVNTDQVIGELKSIADNEAVFKTEYTELKIPLKRIKQIQMAAEKQHRAKRNTGDVRLKFINGDKLTIDLAEITEDRIIGKSENFGKAVFSLNFFKSIELNIYNGDCVQGK